MSDLIDADPSAAEASTEASTVASTEGSAPSGPRGGICIVVNPTKVDDLDALVDRLAERCVELGLPAPEVLRTSAEDPGLGQTRQALDSGATLVIAAGGDGTVRAVAQALVGSGVAMGVIPLGTGNLLARNLAVPIERDAAIDVALSGAERTIDVGRLGDGTVFAVMAGAGFDAAMMRDAPEGLKKSVGWPAYIISGIRSLRRDRVRIQLTLDGATPITAWVRTVVIGNLGKLQGGLELLPDARPDDGRLDVCVVCPRRPIDWVVLLGRAVARRHRPDHRMQTYSAAKIEIRLQRPQPRQVDGDVIDSAERLDAEVVPAAVVLRVPQDPDSRP